MKIDIGDAYTRLTHLKSQTFDIGECCQNLIDQRPFGERSFYIFAHARTDDDQATKRLIWQPRLTKPKAQTNSMLFKWIKGTDNIRVIWMIPERHLWGQFKKGMLIENKTVVESIYNFENKRRLLEAKEPDDLEDHEIDAIYKEISMISKPKT